MEPPAHDCLVAENRSILTPCICRPGPGGNISSGHAGGGGGGVLVDGQGPAGGQATDGQGFGGGGYGYSGASGRQGAVVLAYQ